jgi:hypothetical protein
MRIFWIGFAISFAISLAFPLAVKLSLPRWTNPTRWIQNNPPFSVFMLSAFPIAVGVFCVTFSSLKEVNVFDVQTYGVEWLLYASIGALLILCVLAATIVIHDFTSRPIGPYILRGDAAVAAFHLEMELRESAKLNVDSPEQAAKCQDYQNLIQLNSLGNLFRHGNMVALVYLTIAWGASTFCVFYFWFVAVLVLSNQTISPKTVSKLLMIFILLITWLPMRVHTDWYQNHFHCHDWLKRSYAFWLGIVMAVASLFFVIFISKPEALLIFCTAFNAAVLAFVGLTGRFKPEWLRAVGDFFQSTPFIYFVTAYTVFLFVTAVIGLRIMNE